MSKHRKIYKEHFGPIPMDEDGRTYEIHHIDGNHSNNDPSNLIAVSLREHYTIHFSQGDYGACYLIASKMRFPPDELSDLLSICAKLRVEKGTHNFLGGEVGRRANQNQLTNGTHKFLESGFQREVALKRSREGTHPFLTREDGSSISKDRVLNNTHNFLGENSPTQVRWECPYCGKVGKGKSNYNRHHGDNCKRKTQ